MRAYINNEFLLLHFHSCTITNIHIATLPISPRCDQNCKVFTLPNHQAFISQSSKFLYLCPSCRIFILLKPSSIHTSKAGSPTLPYFRAISSFWFEFWNKMYSKPRTQKSPYKDICIEIDNNGPETIKCFRKCVREVQKSFRNFNCDNCVFCEGGINIYVLTRLHYRAGEGRTLLGN